MRIASIVAGLALASFGVQARVPDQKPQTAQKKASPAQQKKAAPPAAKKAAPAAQKAAPAPVRKLNKHKHHGRLSTWWKHVKPQAMSKLKEVGAHVVKQAEGKASGNAHGWATAKVKAHFPKADAHQIERAVAMALHHASDLLHAKSQAEARKTAQASAKQAAAAGQKWIHDHHDQIEKALHGLVTKFGASAMGKRLTHL